MVLKNKHWNADSVLVFYDSILSPFFRNQVYVGEPLVKPKKNHLDTMFEHIMHSTGHDHM